MNQTVESAAAWLDVRYAGWAERVDLDNFAVQDPDFCIGSYLGVDWHEDLTMGFCLDLGLEVDGDECDVFADESLNPAWRRQIRARQAVLNATHV